MRLITLYSGVSSRKKLILKQKINIKKFFFLKWAVLFVFEKWFHAVCLWKVSNDFHLIKGPKSFLCSYRLGVQVCYILLGWWSSVSLFSNLVTSIIWRCTHVVGRCACVFICTSEERATCDPVAHSCHSRGPQLKSSVLSESCLTR
jgi:hypothetical protein